MKQYLPTVLITIVVIAGLWFVVQVSQARERQSTIAYLDRISAPMDATIPATRTLYAAIRTDGPKISDFDRYLDAMGKLQTAVVNITPPDNMTTTNRMLLSAIDTCTEKAKAARDAMNKAGWGAFAKPYGQAFMDRCDAAMDGVYLPGR